MWGQLHETAICRIPEMSANDGQASAQIGQLDSYDRVGANVSRGSTVGPVGVAATDDEGTSFQSLSCSE